ncbi:hypothetical protein [Brevibacillus borstelensis]|uniref:hypothetical protein n=1 Tax=Brevibacillus borstelensis TaxID=45462 RepID=UPI0030C31C76
MKKFALLSFLSAALLLPSDALANHSPANTSAASTAQTVQQQMETYVHQFRLSKGDYSESGYIYINSPAQVTLTVNQENDGSAETSVEYGLVKLEPDGGRTYFASKVFKGEGTFTFKSDKICPVGTYRVVVSTFSQTRAKGTVTVNIPQ